MASSRRFDRRVDQRPARPGGSPHAERTGCRAGGMVLVLSVAALALLAACGPAGGGGPPRRDVTVLRVFAAASLTDAMADLEQAFEAAEPGIDVELNLAGSATLRAQILEGAPADVVATANPAVMEDLAAAGELDSPARLFAANRLVIAVTGGDISAVTSGDTDVIAGLADLADPGLFVGLCAAGVPCGDLADRVLERAGITVEADTREPDVRALLAKVVAGELDAGLVYATDVTAVADDTTEVTGIELPAELAATTRYPAAVLAGSPAAEEAARFVAFLAGPSGQALLADHGFAAP